MVDTMAGNQERRIEICENDGDVASKLCDYVINKANESVKKRGIFTIGLSGGSMAKYLCDGLPERVTDWSKWRVFFCDERHVPYDNPECTYSIYKKNLMSKVALKVDQVFPDDPGLSVEKAADTYQKTIQSVFEGDGLPRFDLLLLGMGPDGHTCSLFPGHPLLEETKKWVAFIKDSPKPPPERITLTFPVLNNTRCAVFASCGAGKAQMVKEVLEGHIDPPLPASRVRPTKGELVWFLDKAAAGLLESKALQN
ncbi:hypothetical protein LSH36_21g07063 [Paralvinella palmiformis]|uniref:6-phosphogluconolactonase n=1 Tax=Paralvinella palmiformis TaxID=53620 RepID=A0AAD9KAD2_9ANNE|nr:hypothetical protein LSH36_21g07063 [Paralvinella palmiformis]